MTTRCGNCELAEKFRARVMTPAELRECAPLGWTDATPTGGEFRSGPYDDLPPLPPPLPRQPVKHAYHIEGDRFFGQALCIALQRELKWAHAAIDLYRAGEPLNIGMAGEQKDQILDVVEYLGKLSPEDRKRWMRELLDHSCWNCGSEMNKWGACETCRAKRAEELVPIGSASE